MTSASEPINYESLLAQLGAAYGDIHPTQRARHAEMLRSVQTPKDVVLDPVEESENLWTVTVCTWDCIGALSVMAGLYAAYGLNIESVDVFTIHLPKPDTAPESARHRRNRRRVVRRPRSAAPALPTRKLLDIFKVRSDKTTSAETWQQFENDLARFISILVEGRLTEAQEEIIDRVSETARAISTAEPQLLPAKIESSNDVSARYTQLSINSADTQGFLFAFSNALTMLNVNIERAEIRTQGTQVYDTFWLTDSNGHKISDEKRLNELKVAAALIKQFTYLLPRSPNPAQALRQFNALTRHVLSNPDWIKDLRNLESESVLQTLAHMMGVSQFLWDDFLRMQHENLFPVIVDAIALEERKSKDELYQIYRQQIEGVVEHDALVGELNRFKDREMFRIDLRHITNRIGFREFAQELSDLAEVVVAEASELSSKALVARYGVPMLNKAKSCPWSVCALGKFGGRELGFGSDIEMLVVYEAEGKTDGPESIENSRYFGDLVRMFPHVLKSQRDGIFEIDLRLRPYGDKGAMASALDEFRRYYSTDGFARQFERMALVKLRHVAGDADFGKRVVEARDAYVYSGEPLDIENILHLRKRQSEEIVQQGTLNVKYSLGGLVEIEYYVQAWQIITGCKDASVRVTNTIDAINQLAANKHITQERADELREVYGFLRNLIDALRAVMGHAKDLTIPSVESREFAYLANRLQFDSPAHLHDAITSRMTTASKVWDYAIT